MVLSNYATVSDEAFALLCLENNYETWMDMGLTGNKKTSNVPRKYTNGGSSKGKNGTSQHNKDWSDEGLCRFNELFGLVEKNREGSYAKKFEEDFRQWYEDKVSGKQKRVKKLYVEAVQVCHKLWSDNEEEELAKNDPYSDIGHKWIKMDDMNEDYQFDVTNQLKNELLSTPPGCDDDDEDSEDEAARPIPDQSVFHRG
jgi:hypothetical protein